METLIFIGSKDGNVCPSGGPETSCLDMKWFNCCLINWHEILQQRSKFLEDESDERNESDTSSFH